MGLRVQGLEFGVACLVLRIEGTCLYCGGFRVYGIEGVCLGQRA